MEKKKIPANFHKRRKPRVEPQAITIPYMFTPRDYQVANLFRPFDIGKKRLVAVWNRRSGKDKACWNLMVREAFEHPGNYYYIFPTYNQGKKALWDAIDGDGIKFLEHVPNELQVKRNETDMKIEMKTSEGKLSTIQIVGAKEIDRLVGTNPKGIVFSEWSISNPEAWNLMRPILAQNNGWAVFNFTPRGMNHGWDVLQVAKQHPKEWAFSVLTVDDTQSVTPEVLEQEKSEMPLAFFEQEYYCKFLEGASAVFRKIDECVYDGNLALDINHRYTLGVDLAKTMDWTVVFPFDMMEYKAGMPERFNTVDYNVQKSRIETQYYKYFQAKTRIDSTGVGEPIFDDLQGRNLKHLEGFKFTEHSRRDLLTNLQLLLEQQKIRIPRYEPLLEELRSFQYQLNDNGKLRMQVPEGRHDDCVMALALAVWDLPDNPLKPIDRIRSDRETLQSFDYWRQKRGTRVNRRLKYW